MIDQAQTDKFKLMLAESKQALIIFPNAASADIVLASYALFLYLQQQVEIRLLTPKLKAVFPDTLTQFFQKELIETELGRANLLISFPYKEEQVDKVSYFIGETDQRFYLTIKPKAGQKPLDSKLVDFNYAGAEADLVILCGVENLEDLQQLYFGYENLYMNTNARVVSILDYLPDFGSLNLDSSGYSSYCEAVFDLVATDEGTDLEWLATSGIPNLLLYGIESATEGLRDRSLQASAFMVVAKLLQLGAVRLFVGEQDKKSLSRSPVIVNPATEKKLVRAKKK